MLTLLKTRTLLGKDYQKLSDEQIIAIRDNLYDMAHLVASAYKESKKSKYDAPSTKSSKNPLGLIDYPEK